MASTKRKAGQGESSEPVKKKNNVQHTAASTRPKREVAKTSSKPNESASSKPAPSRTAPKSKDVKVGIKGKGQ